jgi:3-oxoacyl-[acyl-carrier protein] reductase
MLLTGMTALVTGSSGAIGRAIALALAREGAAVAVTGRDPDRTRGTVAEVQAIGGSAFAHVADLGRRSETRRLLDDALEGFGGRLDILVNNAGMSYKEPLADVTDDHFDHQVELNFAAPYFLSQGVAPVMRAAGGGRIVFVSSTGASAAHANASVYDAMKAGLEALTRSLAVELGPDGILVNAVQPGHIINDTDVPADPTPARVAHWRSIPVGRPGQPEDVAAAVLYLVSPHASYVTGTVMRVDGGRAARGPVIANPPE